MRGFVKMKKAINSRAMFLLTVLLFLSGFATGRFLLAENVYANEIAVVNDDNSEAEGCVHEWSEWDYSEPDCVDPGVKWRYCLLCDEEEEIELAPPTGKHEWGEWETTREATAAKTGLKVRECYYCDAVQKKTIAKLKAYVKFSKKSYSLTAGKTLELKIKYAKGDKTKKWTSSNSKVAAVNKKGVVKGKKAGTVKITVVMKSGKKASCTVKVKAPKTQKTATASTKSSTGKSSGSSSGSSSSGSSSSGSSSSSGGATVYWTPGGSVYHSTRYCSTLSRSKTIYSGSISESGKPRGCKVCY